MVFNGGEKNFVVPNVINTITLLQTEKKLQDLQQYVKYYLAPNKLIDNCLISERNELRANNASKSRSNPTLLRWLTKKKKKKS